jgi:hypothetical protein
MPIAGAAAYGACRTYVEIGEGNMLFRALAASLCVSALLCGGGARAEQKFCPPNPFCQNEGASINPNVTAAILQAAVAATTTPEPPMAIAVADTRGNLAGFLGGPGSGPEIISTTIAAARSLKAQNGALPVVPLIKRGSLIGAIACYPGSMTPQQAKDICTAGAAAVPQ